MANAGLQPHPDHEPDAVGQFLTFVVPALDGCNLKCPFCLIQQRGEISKQEQDDLLRPEDLVRFIREAAQRAPIFALAIQGYEPLLPDSLRFTQAILATGRFLKLRTTLVTNGTRLIDTVDLLKALAPAKIAISLDAATTGTHDRIRGVSGAWDNAVAGIRRALDVLARQTHVVATSVLIPSRRRYLEGMPARLREIGIDHWIVNPLVHIGDHGEAGGPVGDRAQLFRDLLILQEIAGRAGVRMTVDDEFNHLRHDTACARQPALRALQVRTLPPRVALFRLTPDGGCSRGADVLNRVTSGTPRWRPGATHAGDFLATVSGALSETLLTARTMRVAEGSRLYSFSDSKFSAMPLMQ